MAYLKASLMSALRLSSQAQRRSTRLWFAAATAALTLNWLLVVFMPK